MGYLADTKILTPKGYRNIQDLKVGDCIINPQGQSVKIEDIEVKKTKLAKIVIATEIMEFRNNRKKCVAVHYNYLYCHRNQRWEITGMSKIKNDFEKMEELRLAECNKKQEPEKYNELLNQIPEKEAIAVHLLKPYHKLTNINKNNSSYLSNHLKTALRKPVYKLILENEENLCILEDGVCAYL